MKKSLRDFKRQNGICMWCADVAMNNKTFCEKHAQHISDKYKKIRQQKRTAGECLWCRKSAAENLSLCQDCSAKYKDREEFIKKNNYCRSCKKEQAENGVICENCKLKRNPKYMDRYYSVKKKVFEFYGKTCVCCGETKEYFLCIDHKYGNGSSHRKEIGKKNIYSWLVKNNYPEGFQTLCMNCNFAKKQNSICPCSNDKVYEPFTWIA